MMRTETTMTTSACCYAASLRVEVAGQKAGVLRAALEEEAEEAVYTTGGMVPLPDAAAVAAAVAVVRVKAGAVWAVAAVALASWLACRWQSRRGGIPGGTTERNPDERMYM